MSMPSDSSRARRTRERWYSAVFRDATSRRLSLALASLGEGPEKDADTTPDDDHGPR